MPEPLPIVVYSDVICPWCYVGKRRLEAALSDPGMPAGLADPAAAQIIDAAALDREDQKLLYFGKHAARVGSRAGSNPMLSRDASLRRSAHSSVIGRGTFQTSIMRPAFSIIS